MNVPFLSSFSFMEASLVGLPAKHRVGFPIGNPSPLLSLASLGHFFLCLSRPLFLPDPMKSLQLPRCENPDFPSAGMSEGHGFQPTFLSTNQSSA